MNRTISPSARSARPGFALLLRLGALSLSILTLAGCSGVQALDALVPDSGYRLDAGLAYGSDARQRLDVYRPARETEAGVPRPPMVVFFYGGNWTTGQREDYRFVGQALASAGAVVVVPDYRLSPQVRYPVFLQDSAQAMRWARDHAELYGADPARLVVMGHSAGAYNAAMLALDARWLGAVGMKPSDLSAWIGLAGPYDFLPIGDPATQVAFEWPGTPADSQPLAHASRASPPVLLLVARDDKTVDPERNTARLAEALRADGVEVVSRSYPRVSHATLVGSLGTPLRWLAPVRRDILRFLGLETASGG
ncbi:alpha/beta hydrolase fold domain-containing protein [Xylophilus rhododendri]|uniref:Alpha/beta hydrolase fold domain-containing protein n=1 Tax=Xylophilus rhododendri TaxID=2697032 RepID=A0A857J6R5_9BURK|nr:alpha/beta hydrolase [Xylophilus rhododendri]QHI98933.1 alpha/beta hydrolase fold domain-containing protein [Xylophilus rhododendri]